MLLRDCLKLGDQTVSLAPVDGYRQLSGDADGEDRQVDCGESRFAALRNSKQ